MTDKPKDQALRERASKVIPNGMYGHMAIGARMPQDYPQFFSRAQGSRLWDVDGNEYVDYICAFGPMILGYNDPRVTNAAAAQRQRLDIANGPTEDVVLLAEQMVDMVSHADWAVFSKNGNDATTTCVMAARAYRGKAKVLVADGAYHGAQPWANRRAPGAPATEHDPFPTYTFNDVGSLEAAVATHASDLGGIMVSPFKHDAGFPQEDLDRDFARAARRLADEHDAPLILDDVRAGFRLSLDASWSRVGVQPDLSAWGKALANGEPIAATLGSAKYREAMEHVFVTGSFRYQASPMAAARETLSILRQEDCPTYLAKIGNQLRDGMDEIARRRQFPLSQTGPVAMPTVMFNEDPKLEMGFAFCRGLIDRGIYFHPWHNMFLSMAHTEADIDRTLEAVDDTLKTLSI